MTHKAYRMERIVRVLVALCLVASFVPLVRGTAHAQDAGGDDDGIASVVDSGYVPGEMLVVLKDDISASSASRALSMLDVDVAVSLDQASDAGTASIEAADEASAVATSVDEAIEEAAENGSPLLVKFDEEKSVTEAVEEAMENPAVAYAQPNFIYTLPANEEVLSASEDDETADASSADDAAQNAGATHDDPADLEEASGGTDVRDTPNDPALSNVRPTSFGANAWHLANISAFRAWDFAKTDDAVTVCVLDTGCKLDHEDLADRVWRDYAWNSYSDAKLTKDYEGHGTHCAGLVAAAANNGKGTAGASYNAKVLPICVFDEEGEYCYTSTLVKAYEYLEQYIDALNIRVVSMSLGGYGSKDSSDVLLEQKIASLKEKGVLTVAAGGNGDDYGNPRTDPSYPSDFENVLSVTALSTDGVSPTTWCDYNDSKDICAPGSSIYSTYNKNSSSYKTMSGTSMATPIVAGCAALLWAANPGLTPDEVEAAIKETAAPIEVKSGREGKYGAGRIDLAAAVAKVLASDITEQPADITLPSGKQVNLSIKAVGATVSYAWQYSRDGVTWSGVDDTWTGWDTDTLAFTMADSLDGFQWRCVVGYYDGSTITSQAAVTKLPPIGDVNDSGRVNIVDSQIVLDLSNGVYGAVYETYPLPASWTADAVKAAADVNADAVVDAIDARAIQSYIHAG